jgi:hypothetical protein
MYEQHLYEGICLRRDFRGRLEPLDGSLYDPQLCFSKVPNGPVLQNRF